MVDLTPEARALLETIAGPESAGAYDVIYGGSRFDDFTDHPRQYVTITSGPNKGQKSSAAGKYQFLGSTYDRVAPLAGVNDFTPPSQDKLAWTLADLTYREETGRDLQADLAAGDLSRVAPALRSQWTSMPGGIEQGISGDAFARAYAEALGNAPPQSRDVPRPQARPNTVPRVMMSYAGQTGTGAPRTGLPPVGPTGGPALDAINTIAPQTAMMRPAPSPRGGMWSGFLAPVKTAMAGVTAPVMQAAASPNVQREAIGAMLGTVPGRTVIMKALMNQNIGKAPNVAQGHSGPGTRAMAVTSGGAAPVTLGGGPIMRSATAAPSYDSVLNAGAGSTGFSGGGDPVPHMNSDIYRANAATLGSGGFNRAAIERALSDGKTLYRLA